MKCICNIFTNAFHLQRFFFFFFANQMHLFFLLMHLCYFTNVFHVTNVFAKINAFILCTNAFASEAYHFKANVLAVLIS